MIATSSGTASGWTLAPGWLSRTRSRREPSGAPRQPTPRRARHADQDVGADQHLVRDASQSAFVGALGERRSVSVEVLSAGVEGAAAIAYDHVADAVGEHDVRAGQSGGTCADDRNRDVAQALGDHARGVEQRGEHHDRRAVLVVVEDRNIELGTRRRSISKRRGAAMSSRLIAPKAGAADFTNATISSKSFVSIHSGNGSTPANSSNSIALPSVMGIAAAGPMSPRPRTAVPSEMIVTVLALIGSAQAFAGSRRIAIETRATPGV